MEDNHIKPSCQVRLPGREARVKGCEVQVKESGVPVKETEARARVTGIDALEFEDLFLTLG